MHYVWGCFLLLFSLSAQADALPKQSWNEKLEERKDQFIDNVVQMDPHFSSPRQKKMNAVMGAEVYKCVRLSLPPDTQPMVMADEWLNLLEQRCFVRAFSKILDQNDWRLAEETNAAMAKIRPQWALPLLSGKKKP